MSGAPRSGEDALIARYFAPLAGEGADGLRDDAATLAPGPGCELVLTADAIVAGVHHFPEDPPGSIARKALGVNLSDLAAKGARPRGFLLTLALPDDWTEDWLAAFAAGLGEAAAAFGCPLLGGDTVRSGGPALVSVTAIGEVPAGTMLRRKAGRIGDLVGVTGSIGDAALGLALRLSPQAAWASVLGPQERAHLADRYLHPRPRVALAEALRSHARAAMDVSDGLLGDLAKMLAGTGGRAVLSLDEIPLSPAARSAVAQDAGLLETALAGGDDYEVLFCIAPETFEALRTEALAAGIPVAAIGRVVPGEGPPSVLDAAGAPLAFASASYAHFR